MFKRLIYEDAFLVFPFVAFFVTFFVFVYFVLSAWRMKQRQADYFAKLPLDKEESS